MFWRKTQGKRGGVVSQFLTEYVKQISSRFAQLPYGRNLRYAGAMGVLASILIPLAAAQSVHRSPQAQNKKQKPAPAVVAVPAPEPVAPPPPPVLTPEEMPARAPEVAWDGTLLTINAENSTLSDILTAVHTSTGATIDMPPGSGSERIAVRLGPAPVREVLSSLLYGSNFDYIIQASSTNENGIQSVILTARGKTDDATVAADRPSSVARRMLGYSNSGKRAFEAAAENAEENSTPEPAAAAEVAPTRPEAGSSGAEPAAANAQPPSSTDTTSPAPQSADAGVGAEMPSGNLSPGSSNTFAASSLTSGQTPTSPPSITDLQRMYEQRRQIQMQQNQAQQNQSNPPRTN
jgi:hypothetical protein